MKTLSLFLGIFGLLSASISQAHQQSWPGKRLAETSPQAKSFTKKQLTLSPAQTAWIEKNLGEAIRVEDKTPVFYSGNDESKKVVTYVLFLDAVGANGKVELGVAVSPGGAVLNTVLFEHSEGKGLEAGAFLSQFNGKTATDKFKVGADIKAPSGNEKAAQAIASSIRRGLLMAMAGLEIGQKK